MKAGKLRRQVTIERAAMIEGAYGPVPGPWEPVGTFAASIEPISGREFVAFRAAQSEITTRIRLRYQAGILPSDRITHGDTIYNVLSVIDPAMRNVELELMCTSST